MSSTLKKSRKVTSVSQLKCESLQGDLSVTLSVCIGASEQMPTVTILESYSKNKWASICLEVGCGCGLCSTFLGRLLGPSVFYICTDINPRAAEVTRQTGEENGVKLEPVITDLTSGLTERLAGLVDVLLFNPPYVVTPSEEVGSHGIEASWAGGERGREVMDRIFPVVSALLSEKGLFYLVVIKENDIDEIESLMLGYGLKMEVVISRRAGPEFLSILRFER